MRISRTRRRLPTATTWCAISYRMGGKKLLWDAAAAKITNLPEANKYLTREYRKGWDPK